MCGGGGNEISKRKVVEEPNWKLTLVTLRRCDTKVGSNIGPALKPICSRIFFRFPAISKTALMIFFKFGVGTPVNAYFDV